MSSFNQLWTLIMIQKQSLFVYCQNINTINWCCVWNEYTKIPQRIVNIDKCATVDTIQTSKCITDAKFKLDALIQT